MKNVLVLGAGLVSRPLVHYLLDQTDVRVAIASRTLERAAALVEGRPNARAIPVDAADSDALEALISGCDLVISLLPYAHHPQVARICIAQGKHLITTSYVGPAMRELDQAARQAGVLLLNEVGLDPGVDHMSAMRVIQRVHAAGGKIVCFSSYCGGLPAPEANTNPFGYKFSWSPRGVLLAGKNPARFLREGEIVEIPGEELFDHYWNVQIEGLGEFEGYPNRDSLPYLEIYGIPEAAGLFRGTLRNAGWCSTLKTIRRLGLLSEDALPAPAKLTWTECIRRLIGAGEGASIRSQVAEALNLDAGAPELGRLEWLGLFEDEPLPAGAASPLDALAAQMVQRMGYSPGERDMIVLKHQFLARYPERSEQITATLIEYGIPHGDSAMARTVGLPAAIAARLILEGQVQLAGVHRPTTPEIYEPVLDELSRLGIIFRESAVSFASD